MARLIPDTPADVITLCLGINVYGQATHTERSLLPALLGFLATVRDGHPGVPVLVVSAPTTTVPVDERNAAGLTLADVRTAVTRAVDVLVAGGDGHLTFVAGTDLLAPGEERHLVDRVHPGGSGYRLVAERMAPLVADHLRARQPTS